MRDPRVEQWLAAEGVEWHYEPDIPLTKVDREASLKNQARFKAINQDHVLELAIAAEQYKLPALVGYYSTDRRIVIISGNHRLEAYNLVGKSRSDFYIVDTAYSWLIDRLTRVANTLEGEPLTRDERLSHAMYLVRTSDMPIEAAAKTMGLSGSIVREALAADEVRERLTNMGFSEKLYPTTLSELYRIKQDSALLEAAKVVHEAQLTSEEAAELARRVEKVASSEKAQQGVIAQMRHDYRSRIARTRAGQVRHQILPTIKFRRAIDAINSTRPDSVKPLDKDLARRTRYAIKKLEEINQGEPQSG
jgi:hypothetical protein